MPLVGLSEDDVVAPSAATYQGEQDGYAVFSVGSGEWRFAVGDVPGAVE
ncbi:MAG TPA: hypothetical protein VFZ37_06055 [Jiangellaceae bacterium]